MRLLRLVMPDSRVFKAITDAFDIPTVEAECKQNSYDYLTFTNMVIEIMQQLCSPARDTLVSEIRLLQGNDTIDLFAKRVDSIFEVLDILLLDSANFHLSMSANRLIPEAVPYEQKLFREDVQSGKFTLEQTTLWLNHSKSLLVSEVSWNENADVLAVFQHAMGLLCTSQDGNIPETMHLDLARLSSYRAQASHIVMIAAHMMTAKNLMREKSRYLDPTTWTVMRERLSILIDEQTEDSDATSIAAEINAILDRSHTVGIEADRDERHVTMTHLIVKNTITHPVRKLFTRRLQGLLADTLSGTSITASKIASLGLEDLRLPIETLLTQFEIFARLNWTYYHSWYAQILQSQES